MRGSVVCPVPLVPSASFAPDKSSLEYSISMIWEDNDRIRYVFLPDHGATARSRLEMATVATERDGAAIARDGRNRPEGPFPHRSYMRYDARHLV